MKNIVNKNSTCCSYYEFFNDNTVIAADAPIELKGDVIEYNCRQIWQ